MTLPLLLALSAAVLPLSCVDAAQPAYPTVRAAADAALHALLVVSETEEVGGAIYVQGAAYHYTLGVTQHSVHSVDYRVELPTGATLAALYHSHPGTNSPDQFSPSDVELATRSGVPMFVLVVTHREVIALGAPGFPLDAPVAFATIDIAGKTYVILRANGDDLLLAIGSRRFHYTRSHTT